jgi:hypothetical protein
MIHILCVGDRWLLILIFFFRKDCQYLGTPGRIVPRRKYGTFEDGF